MDPLLDTAPCGFFRLSDEGLIAEANATLCLWLGYPPGSLDGAGLNEVLSQASGVFFETYLSPLLLLQEEVSEVYITLQSVTGDEVPALMSAARRQMEPTTP